MKKMIVLLLCIHSTMCILAQQNLGIRNSNYAGIQGALLNPSSIADSKLKWDINIFSADVVFDNTYLYAPKSSLSLFGFKKIIDGSIHEDLFETHFAGVQDANKLYNLTFSTEILGPSFFMKIAKKHEIGFTIAGRSYANIKDISGNLAQNSFDYFLSSGLWNTDFHDYKTKLNSMGWMQYGLHYATVIYSNRRNELKAGLSVNYLEGIFAAYAKNTHINYNIGDTTNFSFSNSSIDYGRTDYDSYKKINGLNDLKHGHGFGADIGFTYVHLRDPVPASIEPHMRIQSGPEKNDYVYRLGISLIDIGSINFNRNASTYHLQTDAGDFTDWRQSKFSTNGQVDRALSAVFYQGDSGKSLTGDHFKMGLPSALSIQADWNVYKNFFANATIIKGFGHGNRQGVTRPDVYSLTPRYETRWVEVSVPVSVIYYNHWQSRVGLAVRAGYFFIGGDAPGSLLKLNNLEGVDFYAGIHYFIPEKNKNH
jgi:hypothetical protein